MAVDSTVCASCRAAIPAGARFCPQCGSRVGDARATAAVEIAASPPAERRQVAILFADLSGYTHLSSTLDAEEVHRLLTRFFELVDGVISQLGGTIDKHIGDAVMAVFGAPVAHGNDTERALRAAGRIHAAMATLTREFARPLTAHIGVASGEVVAADTGSAAHRNYTMTGDAVNLAARLVELAGATETVISDDVHRALAHVIVAEPQGTVPIRGLGRELPVWKLRGLRAADAAKGQLIGRDDELVRFRAILERASEKTGATVLVCADPGMGKTRITEEFLALAASEGYGRHSAAVLDFGAAQGRDAVHHIYCSLVGIGADASRAERRDALDRALAEGHVDATDEPFGADLLVIPQSHHARYEAMDNVARTEGKLHALVNAVERATARQPLVLLVEDVHWASAWVQSCVSALASLALRSRCILILTSRREGNAIVSGWPDASAMRFDLAPLANTAALALARTFLTANPDVALRCVERAQGNPLFLTQLLRSGADGATIPGTIQSVVLARLDGLPLPDKAALQAASVLGQRFELAVLRHLLQDGSYDCATLQARDLVRHEPADGGHWMFGHALIRDGAYASVLHSGRRALHLRAADWYATRDAALYAEHLDRADDPRAADAYLRAAQAEVAALRIDSALRLLHRASELDAPPSASHALAALEGDLRLDIGDALGGIRAFERALPLADNDAQRCAAWIGIAAGHRVTSTVEPAFAALDRAEDLARTGELDRARSRIHYLRGNLHFAQGNGAACRTEHERALEFARRARDPECEAQALSGLGDANYAGGTMRSAHAAFSRCVAICEQHGLARFAIMNDAMIAIIDTWLGNGEAALARLARSRATARELRHRLAEAMNEEVTGWMLVSHGRIEEAEEHLSHGHELSREIGARRYEMMCLMLLARIDWQRGEHAAARRRLDEAWAISEQTSHGFLGAAVQGTLALVAAGDDERRNALAKGEALLREYSIAHSHLWFNRDAILASLEGGAWSEAERYAKALEDYARAEPLPWTDFPVAVARVLAAAGRGNPDLAALRDCRDRAIALQDAAYVPALDAAIARLGAG
jgi:class 3 adenylate cyclase/tetratricopeptide (TPR) repeat protein